MNVLARQLAARIAAQRVNKPVRETRTRAPASAGAADSTSVRALHRTWGNHAVQRFVHGLGVAQPFLDVSTARGDLAGTRAYLKANLQSIRDRYNAKDRIGGLGPALDSAVKRYRGDKSREVRAEVVRILNAMEEEMSREGVAPTEEVRVGTEFTFTRPSLHELKLNETFGDTKEGKAAAKKQKQLGDDAAALIYDWSEAVKKKVPKTHTVTVTTVKAKDNTQRARRFEYRLAGQETVIWYWVLDMDDGCLETQTQPSSLIKLKSADVKRIIEQDIFGVAGSLKLAPHAEIGGGHISLDAPTLVGSSSTMLLDLVSTLQTRYSQWQKNFEDPDALNAPWMAEQLLEGENALAAYEDRLTQLRRQATAGQISRAQVIQALLDFNTSVKNSRAMEMSTSEDPRETTAAAHVTADPQHYQAINLEHLNKDNGEARIELRRIAAQQNYDDLIAQLGFIYENFVKPARID